MGSQNRTVVRAAAFEDDIFVRSCFFSINASCPYPGTDVKLLHLIVDAINYDIQVVQADSADATIQMLLNDEADMTLATTAFSPTRFQALDHISPVIGYSEFSMAFRTQYVYSAEGMILAPFRMSVWVAILGAFCFSFIFPKLFPHWVSRPTRQGFAVFGIVAVVMQETYCNYLALNLHAKPTVLAPFNNIHDLARKLLRKELQLVLVRNGTLDDRFVHPPDDSPFPEVAKLLREAARENPPLRSDSVEHALEMVANHTRLVHPIYSLSCGIQLHCGLSLTSITDYIPARSFGYYYNPRFKQRVFIHDSIVQFYGDIIGRECNRLMIERNTTCKEPRQWKEISATDFESHFYILIAGMALAAAMFVLEKLNCHTMQHFLHDVPLPM